MQALQRSKVEAHSSMSNATPRRASPYLGILSSNPTYSKRTTARTTEPFGCQTPRWHKTTKITSYVGMHSTCRSKWFDRNWVHTRRRGLADSTVAAYFWRTWLCFLYVIIICMAPAFNYRASLFWDSLIGQNMGWWNGQWLGIY